MLRQGRGRVALWQLCMLAACVVAVPPTQLLFLVLKAVQLLVAASASRGEGKSVKLLSCLLV